jgi:hypothetical protein
MRFIPVAAIALLVLFASPVSFAGGIPDRVAGTSPVPVRKITPGNPLEATGTKAAPLTIRAGEILSIAGRAYSRRIRVPGKFQAETSWSVHRTVSPREKLSMVGTREITRTIVIPGRLALSGTGRKETTRVIPRESLSAQGSRDLPRTVNPVARLEVRGTKREPGLILPDAAFTIHGTREREAPPHSPGTTPFLHPPIHGPQ